MVVAVATACGPPDSGACQAVERPEEQSGSHLIGDATPPVAYSSTPGTSGWHAGGAPPQGVFGADDALTEPQIVSALESGQVVIAYDPDDVTTDDIARLEELATGRFEGQVTVTPFDGDMGAAIVLNGWAVRQACSALDEAALADFVATFGDSNGH